MIDKHQIIDKVNEIYNDQNLHELFLGFLIKSPNSIFLSWKHRIMTESILDDNTAKKYRAILTPYLKSKYLDLNIDLSISNGYYLEMFKVFSNMVNHRYLKTDPDDCAIISWKVLCMVADEHFSSLSHKFKKSRHEDTTNINRLLEDYIKLGMLAPENIEELGLLTYYLMHKCYFKNNEDFNGCNIELEKSLHSVKENLKFAGFDLYLRTPIDSDAISLFDVDLMDGFEFELFVSELFSKLGYLTFLTKSGSDQGVDVIAKKDGDIIGIQAKCYNSAVGNEAIQEIVAGSKHYGCNRSVVITNNYFTKAAIELAQSNKVKLLDRDFIKEKLDSGIFN